MTLFSLLLHSPHRLRASIVSFSAPAVIDDAANGRDRPRSEAKYFFRGPPPLRSPEEGIVVTTTAPKATQYQVSLLLARWTAVSLLIPLYPTPTTEAIPPPPSESNISPKPERQNILQLFLAMFRATTVVVVVLSSLLSMVSLDQFVPSLKSCIQFSHRESQQTPPSFSKL